MLRASGQTKWLCVLFCVLQGWFLSYFLFNIGSNPQTTAAVWPGLWEAERSSEEAFHVGRPTVEAEVTSAEEDRDHHWDENNNDDGDEKGFQPDNYPYLLIHGTEHRSLLLWKKKYDDHFNSDNPPLHDQLTNDHDNHLEGGRSGGGWVRSGFRLKVLPAGIEEGKGWSSWDETMIKVAFN